MGRRLTAESSPQSLLFDTTALIDWYRGKSGIAPFVEQVLAGELVAYISAITEAELWRGLKPQEVDRHNALIAHFDSMMLDSQAARLAGAWMKRFSTDGLGWMDALIVASATRFDLGVLTRDLKLVRCLEREAKFETYSLEATP